MLIVLVDDSRLIKYICNVKIMYLKLESLPGCMGLFCLWLVFDQLMFVY
mgnify:CR=1 FL=1